MLVSADDEKMWSPPRFDLTDEIKSIDRRLDLLSEDSRMRFDLLTEKVGTGLANIIGHFEDFAVRLDRIERNRVEDKKRIDEHEQRLAALEVKRRPAARKKR
jgi:hypothetical protein